MTTADAPRSLAFKLAEGDAGTAQTIAAMRAMVHARANDPAIRATVDNRAPTPRDVYDLIAHNFAFKRDPPRVEYVRDPLRILDMLTDRGRALVDCDDVAVFGCTLLAAQRRRSCFITCRRVQGGPYAHVYFGFEGLWTNPANPTSPRRTLVAMDPQERAPFGHHTPGAIDPRVWWND